MQSINFSLPAASNAIYTIGYDGITLPRLLSLLYSLRVEVLVDVRSVPSSRRFPHFKRAVLERALGGRGVAYLWAGDVLGGLGRRWPEYTTTRDYRRGVGAIAALASSGVRVAVMCSEASWRKCHRSFIAESLARLGFMVIHVDSRSSSVEEHEPGSVASMWPALRSTC